MPETLLKAHQVKSGMFRVAIATEASKTNVQPTAEDVANWTVTVVLPVACDIRFSIFVDYLRNSVGANSQNLIQFLIDGVLIGDQVYISQWTANWNGSYFLQKSSMNLAAGSHTFKIRCANNSAGTLTFGTGELIIDLEAAQ